MPTPTERRIIQKRRARLAGSTLILLLEELLENEIRHEDELDYKFSDMLNRARELPREQGVFSPSMLGSCMRQAFFAKTGVQKHKAVSPQTNGYFVNGDALHKKWQFILWKAHRAGLLELVTIDAENDELDFYGDGTRPAVEMRVKSSSGDFSGTVDAVIRIGKWYYLIDFKGINLVEYQRMLKRGAKFEYKVQIVGYAMIINGSIQFPFTIKKCLLIAECKAGPLQGRGSPLGLHEAMVDVDEFKDEVRKRLGNLREHVEKKRTPPPSCVSTTHMGFQECAFNRFCADEVKAIQRERQAEAAASKRQYKVSRPER